MEMLGMDGGERRGEGKEGKLTLSSTSWRVLSGMVVLRESVLLFAGRVGGWGLGRVCADDVFARSRTELELELELEL